MKKIMLALNVMLGAFVFSTSPAVVAPKATTPITDCCQFSTEGDIFCCVNCCWFTSNCSSTEDCMKIG